MVEFHVNRYLFNLSFPFINVIYFLWIGVLLAQFRFLSSSIFTPPDFGLEPRLNWFQGRRGPIFAMLVLRFLDLKFGFEIYEILSHSLLRSFSHFYFWLFNEHDKRSYLLKLWPRESPALRTASCWFPPHEKNKKFW